MAIRVLLAVPEALRDALGDILAGADDIEIVGFAADALKILLAAGTLQPDVVVVPMEADNMPGITSHLIAEYPDLAVLGLSEDAGRAALYERRPRLVPLGEVSPSGLIDAIRTAARAEAPD